MNEAMSETFFKSSDEEYVETPINEREKEDKFYLQKIEDFYDVDYDEEFAYLNFDVEENTFYLSSKAHSTELKTQFTQNEIDKIKEVQHTDLSEFKQIPVESVIIYGCRHN